MNSTAEDESFRHLLIQLKPYLQRLVEARVTVEMRKLWEELALHEARVTPMMQKLEDNFAKLEARIQKKIDDGGDGGVMEQSAVNSGGGGGDKRGMTSTSGGDALAAMMTAFEFSAEVLGAIGQLMAKLEEFKDNKQEDEYVTEMRKVIMLFDRIVNSKMDLRKMNTTGVNQVATAVAAVSKSNDEQKADDTVSANVTGTHATTTTMAELETNGNVGGGDGGDGGGQLHHRELNVGTSAAIAATIQQQCSSSSSPLSVQQFGHPPVSKKKEKKSSKSKEEEEEKKKSKEEKKNMKEEKSTEKKKKKKKKKSKEEKKSEEEEEENITTKQTAMFVIEPPPPAASHVAAQGSPNNASQQKDHLLITENDDDAAAAPANVDGQMAKPIAQNAPLADHTDMSNVVERADQQLLNSPLDFDNGGDMPPLSPQLCPVVTPVSTAKAANNAAAPQQKSASISALSNEPLAETTPDNATKQIATQKDNPISAANGKANDDDDGDVRMPEAPLAKNVEYHQPVAHQLVSSTGNADDDGAPPSANVVGPVPVVVELPTTDEKKSDMNIGEAPLENDDGGNVVVIENVEAAAAADQHPIIKPRIGTNRIWPSAYQGISMSAVPVPKPVVHQPPQADDMSQAQPVVAHIAIMLPPPPPAAAPPQIAEQHNENANGNAGFANTGFANAGFANGPPSPAPIAAQPVVHPPNNGALPPHQQHLFTLETIRHLFVRQQQMTHVRLPDNVYQHSIQIQPVNRRLLINAAEREAFKTYITNQMIQHSILQPAEVENFMANGPTHWHVSRDNRNPPSHPPPYNYRLFVSGSNLNVMIQFFYQLHSLHLLYDGQPLTIRISKYMSGV